MEFNILVKIALGLDSIDEVPFNPASIFNIQNRVNDHYIRTEESLLEQVFDRLTSDQLKRLKIKTNIQRTDSFAAASNIRSYSLLQLLVEIILRIWRALSEEDKECFRHYFEGYIGKSSGQYIYNLSREDFPGELEKIGQLYQWIDKRLKPLYSEKEIFGTFERVYSEHFSVVRDKIKIKSNEELSSDSLQSPDDLDAACRKINSKAIIGPILRNYFELATFYVYRIKGKFIKRSWRLKMQLSYV